MEAERQVRAERQRRFEEQIFAAQNIETADIAAIDDYMEQLYEEDQVCTTKHMTQACQKEPQPLHPVLHHSSGWLACGGSADWARSVCRRPRCRGWA
jgi:hypothetical protein